jgi:YVTN family beta-propeller protein
MVLALAVAAPAAAAPGWTALVVGDTSNSVTPIDTATDIAGPPIGVGSLPLGVAIAPNARSAYVVNLGVTPGAGSLTPIDLATSPPAAHAAVGLGGGTPNFIAIAPRGSKAYVSNPGKGTVVPLNLRTSPPTPGTPLAAGNGPEGIAFTPDGRKAYVADLQGDTVIPVTVATDTPGPPIPLPANDGPFAVAVTPDGRTAYVADVNGGNVTPIDVATNTPAADIPVGARPQGVAISPDGATVYVTAGGSGTVTPIAVGSGVPGPAVAAGDDPYAIAITPDGHKAYVTNGGTGDDTVVPIDLTAGQPSPGNPVRVGSAPRGIAITPVVTSGLSPALGASVGGATVSGTVRVQLQGTRSLVPLGEGRTLPVGTIVDARGGRVRLTGTSGGKPYTADFYDGRFAIAQKRRRGSTVDLRLVGGSFAPCPRGLRNPRALGAKRGTSIRRLWGDGHGRFRTLGRFSAATIRGTQWLTDDECAGTLTKVTRGSVSVRDFVRRRTFVVGAGRTHLVAAPR